MILPEKINDLCKKLPVVSIEIFSRGTNWCFLPQNNALGSETEVLTYANSKRITTRNRLRRILIDSKYARFIYIFPLRLKKTSINNSLIYWLSIKLKRNPYCPDAFGVYVFQPQLNYNFIFVYSAFYMCKHKSIYTNGSSNNNCAANVCAFMARLLIHFLYALPTPAI